MTVDGRFLRLQRRPVTGKRGGWAPPTGVGGRRPYRSAGGADDEGGDDLGGVSVPTVTGPTTNPDIDVSIENPQQWPDDMVHCDRNRVS